MFLAHVLETCASSASSWLILINKYIEMHGQQNIKTKILPECFKNFSP